MEIEKGQSIEHGAFVKFKAFLGTPCKLSVEWKRLKFTLRPDLFMPDYAEFSQEQVKTLMPYLQAFAENGTLEPTQATLQGGESPVSADNLIKASAQMNYKIYEQGKYIEALTRSANDTSEYIELLENLVREWRTLTDEISSWQDLPQEHQHLWMSQNRKEQLQQKTAQLLGEEPAE